MLKVNAKVNEYYAERIGIENGTKRRIENGIRIRIKSGNEREMENETEANAYSANPKSILSTHRLQVQSFLSTPSPEQTELRNAP
ncbi:hypothetical protein EVAR_31602_1 [Eumeta japonica]|uniref:Uncharacterized protein n=1 Tax=Eumeta variegata TaxID=151549 RepID=A0A4C1VYP5_EUMVA|nr:hypothetical protein EVAR_31602_1 [Eumeta japonica]